MQSMNPFNLAILLFSMVLFNPAHANLPPSIDGKTLPSLANMLEKATPAVVNIATQGRQRTNQRILNDPILGHLFRGAIPKPKQSQGTGSGVIIDANKGHIVTNYHVIANAKKIVVTLHDGRKSSASIIGGDPKADLAIIKITEKDLTALSIADSDKLRVGDFAVAIGNPYGLGQSVTSGIISALGRFNLGIEDYEDFIQTDASINPGNSGGALVDLNGSLIGINTAILGGDGGGNVGIGFAIPSNMMKDIVKQLINYGHVERGQLGVIVIEMDRQVAKPSGAKDYLGATVDNIVYGSPADLAGLRRDDIITHINGIKVKGVNDVRNRVGSIRVGTRVNIRILRKGISTVITAVIGKSRTSLNQKDSFPNQKSSHTSTPFWNQ